MSVVHHCVSCTYDSLGSMMGAQQMFFAVQFSRSVISDSLQPHESHGEPQGSLFITNSQSSIKLVIESVNSGSW